MKNIYISILIILFIILLLSFFLGKNYESFTTTENVNDDGNDVTTYTGNKGNTLSITKNNSTNVNDDISTSGNISVGSSVYDNYNHYSGSSYPTTLYGPNNSTATFTNTNGIESVVITYPNGNKDVFYIDTTSGNVGRIQKYTDSNGNTATIIIGTDNSISLQVTKNGKTILFTENNIYTDNNSSSTNNSDSLNSNSQTSYINMTFYGPNGETAKFVKQNDKYIIIINYPNGKTNTYYLNTSKGTYGSSQKYTDSYGNSASVVYTNGNPSIVVTNVDGTTTFYSLVNNNYSPSSISTNTDNYANYGYNYSSPYQTTNVKVNGPYGGSAGIVTTPYGNSVGYVYKNNNATTQTTSTNIPNYYGSMGITASQIPPGSEDLYILKSQVVPPVCPACPEPIIKTCSKEKTCPPCPPCARCPEPPFKCVKEPNYENQEVNKYLPQPVLNDFSSFGM